MDIAVSGCRMQLRAAVKTEARLLKRSVYATSVLVALVLGLLLCPPTATAAKHPQLPPRYEHWLSEEVNYLISNQENGDLPESDERSGPRPVHRNLLGDS